MKRFQVSVEEVPEFIEAENIEQARIIAEAEISLFEVDENGRVEEQ